MIREVGNDEGVRRKQGWNSVAREWWFMREQGGGSSSSSSNRA